MNPLSHSVNESKDFNDTVFSLCFSPCNFSCDPSHAISSFVQNKHLIAHFMLDGIVAEASESGVDDHIYEPRYQLPIRIPITLYPMMLAIGRTHKTKPYRFCFNRMLECFYCLRLTYGAQLINKYWQINRPRQFIEGIHCAHNKSVSSCTHFDLFGHLTNDE